MHWRFLVPGADEFWTEKSGQKSLQKELDTAIESYVKLKTAVSIGTGFAVTVILLLCDVRWVCRLARHTALMEPCPSIAEVGST